MVWLCRDDNLCDTITTLIYDLMDGPAFFFFRGLQAFQRGGFVCADWRVGVPS